jgi:hypothetical protein
MLSGVLCMRFGSAFAQNAALLALATANWSTTAAASLSTNPPTNAAVTELINYLQTPVIPGVEPNTTCSFGFANLRNSGTLSLVAAVNQGMGYCNSILILDKNGADFAISSVFGARGSGNDISKVLQDVDRNGVYELVVDTDFTWDQGVNHCRASWPVIYGWTGDAYTDVSTKHMRYYKQQIPILQAETPTTFQAPCLAAEIAKLQRFTGIDKTAGLSDAIKWSESNNPHD